MIVNHLVKYRSAVVDVKQPALPHLCFVEKQPVELYAGWIRPHLPQLWPALR